MTYRIACSIALFLVVVLPGCRTIENEEAQNTFDQAAFASADTDGNGRLTEHELALHKHREALAEFDLDNDNHISAAEWAAARPGADEQDEHFNKLDKNSDGTVSEQESVLFITSIFRSETCSKSMTRTVTTTSTGKRSTKAPPSR